jgi:hypothetical protein
MSRDAQRSYREPMAMVENRLSAQPVQSANIWSTLV